MANRRAGVMSVVVALACAAACAYGQTSVNVPVSRTNTLYQDPLGGLSGGAGPCVFSGVSGQGLIHRGLLFFDVAHADIPAGATITGVQLTLNCTRSHSAAQSIGLHRVQAAWGSGESVPGGGGGGGAPAENGDATWLHRFYDTHEADGGNVRWTNPGGDFDAAVLASTLVTDTGPYSWSGAGLTTLVQQWVVNPATNFGVLLQGEELEAGTSKRFGSAQEELPLRPVLTVTYSTEAPHCVADVGVQGGTAGHDGLLDNNDFVEFITLFFGQDPVADMGVQGGTAGHDGLFDNNDFVEFIDAFFSHAGCPG